MGPVGRFGIPLKPPSLQRDGAGDHHGEKPLLGPHLGHIEVVEVGVAVAVHHQQDRPAAGWLLARGTDCDWLTDS